MSGGKEDTFESSSFFDEGVPTSNNRFLFLFQNPAAQQQMQAPPHKCSQVDSYNLPPTIFNTLMFGIDQNKVSSHVRESFSKMKSNSQANLSARGKGTPVKQAALEEEKQPVILRKKSSKSMLNNQGNA